MSATAVCEDVLHWAETYEGPAFHALLCDAPYHLISDTRNGSPRNSGTGPYGRHTLSTKSKGFMGKDWDGGDIAFRPETWAALARHLLPGAFGMTFASSRGWHRLACAIEDAGLIIHPSIFVWAYASGFPKATRIDTQIDERAGAFRTVVGYRDSRSDFDGCSRHSPAMNTHWRGMEGREDVYDLAQKPITEPQTPLAQAWEGHRYGLQALKPAAEPIIVFQKPYAGRPVDSITEHGAGALWIEGGRVAGPEPHHNYGRTSGAESWAGPSEMPWNTPASGRWPANLALCHLPTCQLLGVQRVRNGSGPPGIRTPSIYEPRDGLYTPGRSGGTQRYADPDGTETVQAYRCADGCAVRAFDEQAGERPSSGRYGISGSGQPRGMFGNKSVRQQTYFDAGPASRYFFTADWSLDVAEQLAHADLVHYCAKASSAERHAGTGGRNMHPCIKPLSLCKWLAALLLPPAAYAPRRLLVPFAGTSSEMIGAMLAGWETVLGIEDDKTSVEMGRKRIAWWTGYTVPSTSPREPALQMPTGTTGTGQLNLFGRT